MEEKTQETTKQPFFQKWGWLVSASCGVVSILFLLGTVVTYTTTTTDLVVDVHLWDFFSNSFKMNWSMYITLGLLICGIICACLHNLKKELDSAASMFFILSVTMIALTREFFSNNSIENLDSVEFGWGSAVSIAFAVAAAIFSISASFADKPIKTRDIAEDGILIAAAFILNLIKLPITTGGGSVNFQMLPLFIIALRHGPTHGLVCGGIIYGLLTCLTDGWGFATYPFDYLIGFGSVMVIGYFRNFILSKEQNGYNLKGEIFILVSCLLATLIRFIGSTASSMIVYGVNLVGSLTYNAIYIPVSGGIAIAVLMLAYGPLAKLNNRYPIR